MRHGYRWPSPALALAFVALFVALGGTVYAAKKIDGRTIRAKSLPGNRIKPRSLPGNRLKPRSIGARRLTRGLLRRIDGAATAAPTGQQPSSAQLTGAEIDELSLGQVPEAAHAETATEAQSAVEAETAQTALEALNAATVNGHSAGCLPGTQPFAGACWQTTPSETALTAPAAAASCAAQGGALPEALALAAFAAQPGIALAKGDEWSGDVTNMSGLDAYAVVTVSAAGGIDFTAQTNTRKFRCVVPLLT
jgi:hypothetical protein